MASLPLPTEPALWWHRLGLQTRRPVQTLRNSTVRWLAMFRSRCFLSTRNSADKLRLRRRLRRGANWRRSLASSVSLDFGYADGTRSERRPRIHRELDDESTVLCGRRAFAGYGFGGLIQPGVCRLWLDGLAMFVAAICRLSRASSPRAPRFVAELQLAPGLTPSIPIQTVAADPGPTACTSQPLYYSRCECCTAAESLERSGRNYPRDHDQSRRAATDELIKPCRFRLARHFIRFKRRSEKTRSRRLCSSQPKTD